MTDSHEPRTAAEHAFCPKCGAPATRTLTMDPETHRVDASYEARSRHSDVSAEALRAGVAAAWTALRNDVLNPGDWARQLPELFDVGRRNVERAYADLSAAPSKDDTPRQLVRELAETVHQTGSIHDHNDESDRTGWNVHGIETCSDPLCVEALAYLAATDPTPAEGPKETQ